MKQGGRYEASSRGRHRTFVIRGLHFRFGTDLLGLPELRQLAGRDPSCCAWPPLVFPAEKVIDRPDALAAAIAKPPELFWDT